MMMDITARKEAEEALKIQNHRMQSILRAAPAGIGVVRNRVIVDVNEYVCSLLGYEKGELIGSSSRILYPSDEDYEYVGKEKYRQISEKGTGSVETRWITRDGKIIDIILSSTPIYPDDLTKGVTFTAIDISDKKISEQRLIDSLREKEILLKEIHHRVKNNLQVVISLLNLQARKITDDEALRCLAESQNRIRAMAMIHENLYMSENLSKIIFSDYLRSITRDLFMNYNTSAAAISLQFDLDEVFIGIDQAIPCGLIVNELVTNTLKYAFPQGFEVNPVLAITLKSIECGFELSVFDNGIGLPEGIKPGKTESFGLTLVGLMAGQIKGELSIERINGTKIKIRCPNGK